MLKKVPCFLFFVFALSCGAVNASANQIDHERSDIEKRLIFLEEKQKRSKVALLELKKKVSVLSEKEIYDRKKIEDLYIKLSELEKRHLVLVGSLHRSEDQSRKKYQDLDYAIKIGNVWYGALAAAFLLLLSGCFWYLWHLHKKGDKKLISQIKISIDAVRAAEEKIAKSDTMLADYLCEVLKKNNSEETEFSESGRVDPREPDHHLPLKLADEIHRMRKRLSSLPESTKGLISLKKSLERLESELEEQGYEIVDHTGMPYTENLSVKARFVPSDHLEPDQRVVGKVVIPQVNYRGVMVRMADVEVSIGS